MSSSSDFNVDEILSQPVNSTSLTRWERKAVKTGKEYDRFIPNREGLNSALSLHSLTNENTCPENLNAGTDSTGSFNNCLAQSLFAGEDVNSKILSFKKKAPKPSEEFHHKLKVLYTQQNATGQVKKTRHISSTPERVLDAPDLVDDYYLNLLDWSSRNVLAVALGPCVYLWDAATGSIELLFESAEDTHVTSIRWMEDGSHLAVGMSTNELQMWDVSQQKRIRMMRGHQARVGALAWNNHILTSGSRDTNIFHNDVRIANHHVATLGHHTQEVCGLEWSPDRTQLASGGNDNMCYIWDASNDQPRHSIADSSAAVKALAWCPWEKNLLATGSGTADRHIRFYNSLTGSIVNSIDTGSQVCSLIWSKNSKELMSSHGFADNQLTFWNYPSMAKVAELTGHTSRVLHTALSTDGTMVCSAAADETLRFWNVWEAAAKKKVSRSTLQDSSSSRLARSIR